MTIIGTNGVLELDGFSQKFDIYNNDVKKAQWEYFGGDMDYLLVKDFLEACKNNTPVKVTGEDGLKTLEVALAAYESGKRHQPVAIEEIRN